MRQKVVSQSNSLCIVYSGEAFVFTVIIKDTFTEWLNEQLPTFI